MENNPIQNAIGSIWYGKVDPKQMRLRVAEEFWSTVRWTKHFADKTIECLALPGAEGQLRIRPVTVTSSAQRVVTNSLQSIPATFDEHPAIVALARYHAVGRPVKITREPPYKRCTITMSADLASAGFGPDRGEKAAVFTLEDIVEIWSVGELQKRLKETANGLIDFERAAIDAIRERGD
jgi:hypothetical protein